MPVLSTAASKAQRLAQKLRRVVVRQFDNFAMKVELLPYKHLSGLHVVAFHGLRSASVPEFPFRNHELFIHRGEDSPVALDRPWTTLPTARNRILMAWPKNPNPTNQHGRLGPELSQLRVLCQAKP